MPERKEQTDFCKAGIWKIENGQVVAAVGNGAILDCRKGSPDYGKQIKE